MPTATVGSVGSHAAARTVATKASNSESSPATKCGTTTATARTRGSPPSPPLLEPPVSGSETEFARDIAYQIVGKDRVVDQGPLMLGSEDFAYMLQEVPGCYFFVGNGAGDAMGACAVHNPKYDFNDTLIGVGASYWVALTNQFLVP
ncbi:MULTISPECIES: M20/M25/M40 family metallo-hydrolase [Comamonadaceae]|uniref:M20/M25/M40 family metallo-hydrolase n=1 Tax=Comamonadaceae TaxID=80864 RepID=UPI003644BCBD